MISNTLSAGNSRLKTRGGWGWPRSNSNQDGAKTDLESPQILFTSGLRCCLLGIEKLIAEAILVRMYFIDLIYSEKERLRKYWEIWMFSEVRGR